MRAVCARTNLVARLCWLHAHKKTKGPRAATRMSFPWRQETEFGSRTQCLLSYFSSQFPAATGATQAELRFAMASSSVHQGVLKLRIDLDDKFAGILTRSKGQLTSPALGQRLFAGQQFRNSGDFAQRDQDIVGVNLGGC